MELKYFGSSVMIESHFSPGFPARKIEVFLSVRNLIHTCFNTRGCVALQHYMKEKDGVLAGKPFVIVDREEGACPLPKFLALWLPGPLLQQ